MEQEVALYCACHRSGDITLSQKKFLFWAPLHKTMATLQLMVSLQSTVTTIATLLHSQSKSRNQ